MSSDQAECAATPNVRVRQPSQRMRRSSMLAIAGGIAIVGAFVMSVLAGGMYQWSRAGSRDTYYIAVGNGELIVGRSGSEVATTTTIAEGNTWSIWDPGKSRRIRASFMPRWVTAPMQEAVRVPLWAPVGCGLGVCVWLYRRRPRPRAGECRGCGYVLAGIAGGRCPECGTELATR